MKKLALILLAGVIFSFLLTGCASFGDHGDWERGDWYGFARPDTVARMEQDKLALKKLESLPADAHPVQGYRGVIKSNAGSDILQVKLEGPENKSFFLNPGDQAIDYLIPGNYKRTLIRNDKIFASQNFIVGAQKHYFAGGEYHWVIIVDD